MNSYDATVTREDDLWVAEVHGLPANMLNVTDAPHFADLHDDVPEMIAGLTGTEPDDITVHWRYEVNGRDVTEALGRFLAIEAEIGDKLAARESARKDAIRTLTDAGLSRRATGDAVGLSGGRVQQLVGG